MNTTLKSIVTVVSLILSFSGLKAQQKPLVATCESGQGCVFQISDATYEEVDIVLDGNGMYANMSRDDMIVFAKGESGWDSYIEGEMSRSELDRAFGGDGYTKIYLFNPRLQPLDGQWKVQLGTASGTDCFVDITSILNNGLAGLTEGGTVNFPEPFDVKFLMNNPNVKWRMVNPNQYRGLLDFSAGASSPMKLIFDIKLVNEKRIEGAFTVNISVPTKEPCLSQIPITYTCVEANPSQRRRYNEIDPFEEKKKFNVDRLPDDRPKGKVGRLPDDPKPNVDRLPDDRPKGNVDRLPDDPPKPKVDRLPDDPPKPKVDRLPDDPPKPKVEWLPDN